MQIKNTLALVGLFIIAILLIVTIQVVFKPELPPATIAGQGVKKFTSLDDAKTYLQNAMAENSMLGLGGGRMMNSTSVMKEAMPITGSDQSLSAPDSGSATGPDRYSQTNVQVAGIDEPDIVKTDGVNIFLSTEQYYGIQKGGATPMIERIMPPQYQQAETKVVKALPASDLALASKIDKTGNLLLDGKTLVIFSGRDIFGYDVTDATNPQKIWENKIDDGSWIASSRLYQNKIYLVVQKSINIASPCPIQPMVANGQAVSIKCESIYHPVSVMPVDSTFVVTVLNPANGQVENTVSFVGSQSASTIYMSANAIYLAYQNNPNIFNFMLGLMRENKDVFPKWMVTRMEKVASYDLSDSTKLVELVTMLQQYMTVNNGTDSSAQEKILEERGAKYYETHKRELERTDIVAIDLKNLNVSANGSVPGYLLNNFSLDEYKGNLRVAITIGQSSLLNGIGGSSSGGSVSDVYILDKDLKEIGSVKDLGKGERIYSARFVGDQGYIVTFKQTDPFYVLDLSNSASPKLSGELKIPGYSSYLHPISDSEILGIGKEGQNVKVSLFDVSDATNPTEKSKYSLNEYWTDLMSNYHAFMIDKEHDLFFMPAGGKGYIISFKDGILELIKTVEWQGNIQRAIYINNNLYLIGNAGIVIFDENTWEKVNELSFSSN